MGKRWVNKGIHCIAHFVIENGQFISYDQFKEKCNSNMDFLTFAGIRSAIRTYIRTTDIKIVNNKYLNESKSTKILTSASKGSRLYYDILIENGIEPKCCMKWNEKFSEEIDWKSCFLKTHKVSDVKLKWFQIRILHRCLGTNVILKEIGVLNSDLCSFCSRTKDSIRHMFWQCAIIQQFWKNLTNTMNMKCKNIDNFNMSELLAVLGCEKNIHTDAVVDFIILFAKQHIYQCKLQKTMPNLPGFLNKLKYRYQIEEFISRKNLLHNEFSTKWYPYKTLFN